MLALFVICVLFILLYRVSIPTPISLSPDGVYMPDASQYIASIDKTKIYEHDLFDTFIAPTVQEQPKPIVATIPAAPAPVTIRAPQEQPPSFLEPLNITLTGIIMTKDLAASRAIILDNVTKQEVNYKIGDELEDAQIMRIFKDRILLVRSNGQQETIYLTPQAAAQANEKLDRTDWSSVVVSQGKNKYILDVRDFADTVKTVGEFIELADLATAYMHGQSIGCKVGIIQPHGLVATMGLKKGDIITAVDGHLVYTAAQRIDTAEKLAELPMGSTIKVELLRQSMPITVEYVLGEINRPEPTIPVVPEKAVEPLTQIAKQITDVQQEEKIKLLETREKFAPTLQEIERGERQRIMNLMKKKTV